MDKFQVVDAKLCEKANEMLFTVIAYGQEITLNNKQLKELETTKTLHLNINGIDVKVVETIADGIFKVFAEDWEGPLFTAYQLDDNEYYAENFGYSFTERSLVEAVTKTFKHTI